MKSINRKDWVVLVRAINKFIIYLCWLPIWPSFALAAPLELSEMLDSIGEHQTTQPEKQLPQLESALDSSDAGATSTASPSASDIENTYILGPGDQIRVDVYGAPEYSGDALVLSDGALTLPRAGRIYVRGISLKQTEELISSRYSPFIHHPRVTVIPTVLRPVSLGVVGAVKRPGTYTIPIQSEDNNRFPTLTDAIQLAGGIDSQADIRQIEIYRSSQSEEAQIINVDLWKLLQDGDMSEDIQLHSGDTISVPTAEIIDPEEAAYIGSASFSPEFVTVYVVGEVSSPGPVNLSPNTPLNQAILAAGGFNAERADSEQISLVRLNTDGTINQRTIDIDFASGINENSNPILRENDVVVVERSGLASVSDTAGLALGPVGGFLNSILGIFRLF